MSASAPSFAAAPLGPRLYPLGETAVVLEFGTGINEATNAAIQAVAAQLAAHPFPGFVELVPAFATLTVFYDPWQVSQTASGSPFDYVARQLRQQLGQAPAPGPEPTTTGPAVEIPVCYGGEFGPDLAAVARHCGLSPEEVVARHAGADYQVHFIGFAPGFPYLGGLPAELAMPRRASPRAAVPAGAVGIAGAQTGIYSLPTPGGWQLIGRTPERLFRPEAVEPSRLRAGQRLRFVSITAEQFRHWPAFSATAR
ncbi:5-oxoprolinase subunit PxpB [Hymenobacter rubripertinctus]|uniref:5-oxoprolinase subunit PxpB n=1 Tax=Hymenobacter rubripertinctus TaxID=2029981 RepID=A0A418QLW2_9BACT|nr:5-oxoprolinase subunit PxpB [Hymenobacter rubripertinctus]RIY06217.1 5-oxoprolinase subunit PxpB [Hymenobacter rubripertinctus]